METLQNKLVLALLAYSVRRNLDPQRLCDLSGIQYAALIQSDSKVLTDVQIESLWKNVSHLTGDPLFGLHFGESMQLAALGVVGQMIQTSSTVGDALANACALTPLVSPMFQMQLEYQKSNFAVLLKEDQKRAEAFPSTFRHTADYLLAFVVHELNGLLLQRIEPVSVQVPYPLHQPKEYERVFNCSVIQNKTILSIQFPEALLKQSILSANYELQNLLLQKFSSLSKSEEAGSLQTKVYNHLLANSYLQVLSIESVAANFNMSVRSLQRKLKDEGVSYQQIVEEARKNLAINYVTSGNYSIKDISYILGYNEQSAFLRAFKRWTGKTPSTYTVGGTYLHS